MTPRQTLCLVPLLAVALAACQAYVEKYVEPKVDPNLMPTNYQTRLLDQLRDELDDPTGIRDASITDPTLKQVGPDMRYVVCTRFNSKDSAGRYAPHEKVAYFFGGQMTQFVDAPAGLCANVAYKPFPELQKLCRQLRCGA